jgi:hypothetical protein
MTTAGRPATPATLRTDAMSGLLVRNWWAVALRGASAFAWSVVVLGPPGATLQGLVVVFAGLAALMGSHGLAMGLCAYAALLGATLLALSFRLQARRAVAAHVAGAPTRWSRSPTIGRHLTAVSSRELGRWGFR